MKKICVHCFPYGIMNCAKAQGISKSMSGLDVRAVDMSLYIDVIVDISVSRLDRIFQYRVPEVLETQIIVGRQVLVPFGKGNRQVKGFIVGAGHEAAYDESKMKDVLAVDDGAPAAQGQLIALAEWIRQHYGSTMVQSLKTVLPVRRHVREVRHVEYVLADRTAAEELLRKSRQNKRDKARVRLLEALLRDGRLPKETVTGILQISPATLKAVIKSGAMREESSQIYRNPVRQRLGSWKETILNDEQKRAVEEIWQQGMTCRTNWT